MKKVNLLLLLFFCTINAQIALPTFQAVHTPHYTANEQLNYAVYTSISSYYASTYQDIIDNQGDQDTSGTTSSIGGPASSTYGLINFTSQTHLETAIDVVDDDVIPTDNFSLTVSGYFIPQESGTYTFTCEGDDGVFFLLNGSVVASHPGGHGTGSIGTHTGTISLTAGTKYTLNAYMQEKGGGIGLRIFWKTPSNSTWTIHADEISSE